MISELEEKYLLESKHLHLFFVIHDSVWRDSRCPFDRRSKLKTILWALGHSHDLMQKVTKYRVEWPAKHRQSFFLCMCSLWHTCRRWELNVRQTLNLRNEKKKKKRSRHASRLLSSIFTFHPESWQSHPVTCGVVLYKLLDKSKQWVMSCRSEVKASGVQRWCVGCWK